MQKKNYARDAAVNMIAAGAVAGYNYITKPSAKQPTKYSAKQSTKQSVRLNQDATFQLPRVKPSNKRETKAELKRKALPVAAGVYQGQFKKPKANSKKTEISYDSNIKYEAGSLETSAIGETIYIGHSVAPRKIVVGLFQTLIRMLFKRAGYTIINFKDLITDAVPVFGGGVRYDRIVIEYKVATRSQTNTGVSGMNSAVTGKTFEDIANDLRVNVQAALSTGFGDTDEWFFKEFTMAFELTNSRTDFVAALPAEQLKVRFDFVSHLKLQNRTNNAANTSSTETNNQNPLEGKLYYNGKPLNGFDLARTSLVSEPSRQAFYTYLNTGIISTDSGESQATVLKRPPQPWVLGAKKSVGVILQPGAIRDTSVSYSATMYFNTWVAKLGDYFCLTDTELGSTPRRLELGFAQLIGLCPLLNDRTESEVSIQVGWEIDQTYSFKGEMKKVKLLQLSTIES